MSKVKLLLLSVASGCLLAFAWPEIVGITTLIFIAFVPLLHIEHEVSKRNGLTGITVFGYAYLSFFLFNLITTYWIYHASLWGAAMAIICNALFMAIVFWLFHITKKRVGHKEGYIGLIIYWLAFEYLHLNWELSWPWLTLGNVFANSTNTVQWYEYTGILGGSLLTLLCNVLFFKGSLLRKVNGKFFNLYFNLFLILIIVASGISRLAFSRSEKEGKVEAVIVQPNIDPYNEKFNGIPASEQIERMIKLAEQKLTATTDYLILPETAIPEAHWEHELNHLYEVEVFRKLTKINPELKIVVGMSSSLLFMPGQELSATANQFRDGSGWYDNFNTAIQIDSSSTIPLHHKSKLVLGVEKLPFIRSIPLMKKLSINLGGASGGLGTQEKPSVFGAEHQKSRIAPIICYESIYGEYVAQYSNQGANVLSIITNDGWWDDTPGYKQHLAYAKLRAIENRRSILRSANTGISAIINERGEIIDQTQWWEPAVIAGEVQLNDQVTFYMQYGDFLGRTAAFIAPLLILLTLVKKLNKTEQRLSSKKNKSAE